MAVGSIGFHSAKVRRRCISSRRTAERRPASARRFRRSLGSLPPRFVSSQARRFHMVDHRKNAIVNRLTKTKHERVVDYDGERAAYQERTMAAAKAARTAARDAALDEDSAAEAARREEEEARASYIALFTPGANRPPPPPGDEDDTCGVMDGGDDGFVADDGGDDDAADSGAAAPPPAPLAKDETEEDEEAEDAAPDVAWLQARGCDREQSRRRAAGGRWWREGRGTGGAAGARCQAKPRRSAVEAGCFAERSRRTCACACDCGGRRSATIDGEGAFWNERVCLTLAVRLIVVRLFLLRCRRKVHHRRGDGRARGRGRGGRRRRRGSARDGGVPGGARARARGAVPRELRPCSRRGGG